MKKISGYGISNGNDSIYDEWCMCTAGSCSKRKRTESCTSDVRCCK